MKKILILMLASALLLSSCGGKNNDESANDTTNDNEINNTLGDENGDGKIEDESDTTETELDTAYEETTPEGDDTANGGTAEGGVTSVTTAEEAVTFIDVNVYSQCMDVLPMSTMSMVLPTDDMDIVTYNTGLTDLTGVNDIIVSESMIGSFAYSLVMLRTDGTNTDELQTTLGEQIDPAKWVCVNADKIQSVRLDNDIILVMSKADYNNIDAIMNAVLTAAEGVYTEIGSVVNVLG